MWYDTYTIRRAEATSDCQEQERTMNQHKQLFERLAAAAFWLAVWQCAAMAVGQEVFLVSPVQALRTLLQLLSCLFILSRRGLAPVTVIVAYLPRFGKHIFSPAGAAAWQAKPPQRRGRSIACRVGLVYNDGQRREAPPCTFHRRLPRPSPRSTGRT